MKMKHKSFVIEFNKYSAADIIKMVKKGLFDEIATLVNSANRNAAELNFYYCSIENGWPIPQDFKGGAWPNENDYREVPEEIESAQKAEEQEKEYRRKFARSGGLATSDAKTLACRENGKKGGWKKGRPRGKRTAGGSGQAGVTWPAREFTEKDLPF